MDSNGTRFVLIKGAHDFRTHHCDCGWNPMAEAFMLARQDQPRLPNLDPGRVMQLWREATPHLQDDYGQIGRLSSDRRTLEWSLNWPGNNWQPVRAAKENGVGENAAAVTLDPVDAPAGAVFTDLHLGGSGLIALPFSN